MARMLSILKTRREVLIDRWMDMNPKEKTKLLVNLMDLEDDIDVQIREDKRRGFRKAN